MSSKLDITTSNLDCQVSLTQGWWRKQKDFIHKAAMASLLLRCVVLGGPAHLVEKPVGQTEEHRFLLRPVDIDVGDAHRQIHLDT